MAFFENAFFVHGSSFECTLVEVLVVEERRAAFSCFYSYCLYLSSRIEGATVGCSLLWKNSQQRPTALASQHLTI